MVKAFEKKDLGQLWEDFKESQSNPDLIEWQKKVYVPGMASSHGYQCANRLSGVELQAEVISEDLNLSI